MPCARVPFVSSDRSAAPLVVRVGQRVSALDGEGLVLQSLALDGKPLGLDDYRARREIADHP